jgi:hypothetical protein
MASPRSSARDASICCVGYWNWIRVTNQRPKRCSTWPTITSRATPKAGIELLDQFAARVTLPPWQLAGRYANLHGFAGDRDRERAIHAATARDPRTPEAEQASAWFWHAHSFFQQQRYEEAAAGFAAILRDYGTNIDAGIQQTVAGARNHLEQAQQAMQKRVERR